MFACLTAVQWWERPGMEKRCLREVRGSYRAFRLHFSVAISPTSPCKQRNWLYSADQDGDSEWQGGRGGGRTGTQAAGERRAGGEIYSKKTLEFHSKNWIVNFHSADHSAGLEMNECQGACCPGNRGWPCSEIQRWKGGWDGWADWLSGRGERKVDWNQKWNWTLGLTLACSVLRWPGR